ncbi:MAG TPA: response regulator transcription factor [Flavobacteriales bacterium]|nr:response regulator transcription factor [Flavobacteriales bacterium]HRP80839.1 response regulator transcription factor [Flavobacteriales bacterium]HRQ84010.1 response regulator transcription factor [Flavobacteriales bacterium]
MAVRTLIADKSEIARVGLRGILEPVARIAIVGEACDTAAMLRMIPELQPDVVLIDHTSDGFGAEAVRDALRRNPRTRFIATTPSPSQSALMNALRAGVCSYIKKDCGREEIIDAVLHTGDGQKFFCGKILRAIREASLDVDNLFGEALDCAPVTLSGREAEIIGLIAEGYSYTRIAEQLCLSAHTITTHRRNIMQKLGVNNTAALVLYAVKKGLVSPNKFVFNA